MFLFSIQSKAQNSMQYWTDYYQYRQLNSGKWKMSNRFGMRFYPDEDYNFRFSYRPDIAKNVRQHGRFIAGNGFFYIAGDKNVNNLEIRPWVGFKRSPARLTSVSLTHYVRWENRFFLLSDNDFENRFRYKITAEADLYRKKGKALSVVLEPEIFISFGAFDDFNFNRLRVTSGFRYQWNADWRSEVFVTRQDTRANGTLSDGGYDWIVQLKLKRLLIKK